LANYTFFEVFVHHLIYEYVHGLMLTIYKTRITFTCST